MGCKKVDECKESSRDARDVIGRLQVAGGVETIDALRTAIRQSDEMRDLKTELTRERFGRSSMDGWLGSREPMSAVGSMAFTPNWTSQPPSPSLEAMHTDCVRDRFRGTPKGVLYH